jgi:hypothetical protein
VKWREGWTGGQVVREVMSTIDPFMVFGLNFCCCRVQVKALRWTDTLYESNHLSVGFIVTEAISEVEYVKARIHRG